MAAPAPSVTDKDSRDDATRRLDERLHEYRVTLAAVDGERPLHRAVPGLTDIVPFRKLADGLPTPVTELEVGGSTLLVKRDDLTSSLYGGNKVRKLEWLLGAPAAAHEIVVTGGGTASNHVLATVLYGRLLGVETEAVLFDQPPNPGIEELAAIIAACDTRVHKMSSMMLYPLKLLQAAAGIAMRGRRPRILYPGGSTGAGALGFVNCALEIAACVDRGEIEEPELAFCALGSAGTAVGLAIGFELAGLRTRVAAVRTADAIANGPVVLHAIDGACRGILMLAGRRVASGVRRIDIVDTYYGDGYGAPTSEGTAAVEIGRRLGIPVEQTYTGKALAAALDRSRSWHPSRGPLMFVDTVSATYPLAR